MKVEINGKKVEGREGETILDLAKREGVKIPTLCHHPDVQVRATCRVCVVQVNKKDYLPACSTKIEDGMVVETDNLSINELRRTNLELLFSQHEEKCPSCIWNLKCQMLEMAKDCKVKINKYKDRKSGYPVYNFGPSLSFDSSKCIDCRNCIEVCKKQGVGFLEVKGRGHLMEIFPSEKADKDCVFCGQCILHCPAGAFKEIEDYKKVEDCLNDKSKTVIFQIAPAVRATIGEEFGVPYGENVTGKLVASLKKIGADKVLDVPIGADITTVEESKELLEKMEKEEFPLFTACCPSWVKFIEFYYPEFIPNLTTVRSPQIILGGLIKKYFKEEDVFVVSIMPCVAKKYEIEREELKVGKNYPVDYVMTTRELGRFLKSKKIDFKDIEDEELDDLFMESSSSGVSYGKSGGVMQSAVFNVSGNLVKLKETEEGVKEGELDYKGKKLKLAVVSGLGNAKNILEELKINPNKYDYIEVMACPGGCIGGGGQSVPTSEEIVKKRKEGLSNASEKREENRASESPGVKKIYREVLNCERDIRDICYTKYFNKKK